jgi:hypothetical protein
MILLLEDNVMFTMPILELARQHGESVIVAENAGRARDVLAERSDLRGILLDMRLVDDDLLQHIPPQVAVAAFGPHVEGASFLAMRQRGVKSVWPNSKLRERLPDWMQALP